jgi:hypothetical protein
LRGATTSEAPTQGAHRSGRFKDLHPKTQGEKGNITGGLIGMIEQKLSRHTKEHLKERFRICPKRAIENDRIIEMVKLPVNGVRPRKGSAIWPGFRQSFKHKTSNKTCKKLPKGEKVIHFVNSSKRSRPELWWKIEKAYSLGIPKNNWLME